MNTSTTYTDEDSAIGSEYDDEDSMPHGSEGVETPPTDDDDEAVIQNKPYDEAHEVSGEDEHESVPSESSHSQTQQSLLSSQGMKSPGGQSNLNSSIESSDASNLYPVQPNSMLGVDTDSENESDSEQPDDEDEDDDDEEEEGSRIHLYNPAHYANLDVGSEVQQLFESIQAYKPHNIVLDTKLSPFIPNYLPAVGDLDPFLKVPRPDGKPDGLGLVYVDEPRAEQSNPTVIKMMLSRNSTNVDAPTIQVPSIQKKDSAFPMQIDRWIENIEGLHKKNPSPTVHYGGSMPDIDQLMQPWPKKYQEMLNKLDLPGATLDMSTDEYAKIICALLDIPSDNIIESLHLLFNLYLSFKENPHFAS